MRHLRLYVATISGLMVFAGCGRSPSDYTSTPGNFRVTFPAKPQVIDQDVELNSGVVKIHTVVAVGTSGASRAVSWNNYPIGLVRPESINPMLEAVVTGRVNQANGRELERTTIDLDGHPGREIRYESPAADGAGTQLHLIRVYLVGDRLYQVAYSAKQEKPNLAASKAFFDSFTLLSKVQPIVPNSSEPTLPMTVTTSPTVNMPVSPSSLPAPSKEIPGWGSAYDPLNDCQFEMKRDVFTITVPGTLHDFNPPPESKFDAPRVLQNVNGDFTVEVEVPSDPQPSGKSVGRGVPFLGAGIVVAIDDMNFARLERAGILRDNNVNGYFLFEGRDRGQRIGQESHMMLSAKHIRLERRGSVLTAYASMEGQNWSPIGRTAINWPAAAKVGVMAVNSTDRPFVAGFQGLKVSQP